jgi:site-specific recombinase XerD
MATERRGKVRYKQSLKLQKQPTAAAVTGRRTIYPIEKGIKSLETQKQYRWQLNAFLRYIELTEAEQLLRLDRNKLEEKIIEYLDDYLTKKNHLKHASVNTAKAAIFRFCIMNDILLNKDKISKSLSVEDEASEPDYAYSKEEIRELLRVVPDERDRVIIYLMASSGMRVGSIPDLEFRDLTEIPLPPDNIQKVYKIMVYNRSPRHRYYTFVTPECYDGIQKYLEFRKGKGEFGDSSKQDKVEDIIINNPTSPLIREQFDVTDKAAAARPKKVGLSSIEKVIERAIDKAGIKKPGHRVMKNNGFRKYALSKMRQAKVDFSDREFLIGHKKSRALEVNYDRATEEERLVEWSKSINYLTLDKSFNLEKELKVLQGETNQRIAEQSQEIARLKAKEHEDNKALGELSKEFNKMKQLLVHLSKDSQKQLVDEFFQKVGDKADIEWSCD